MAQGSPVMESMVKVANMSYKPGPPQALHLCRETYYHLMQSSSYQQVRKNATQHQSLIRISKNSGLRK